MPRPSTTICRETTLSSEMMPPRCVHSRCRLMLAQHTWKTLITLRGQWRSLSPNRCFPHTSSLYVLRKYTPGKSIRHYFLDHAGVADWYPYTVVVLFDRTAFPSCFTNYIRTCSVQVLMTRPRDEWISDVSGRYRALEQFSKEDARLQFLRILRSLPYGTRNDHVVLGVPLHFSCFQQVSSALGGIRNCISLLFHVGCSILEGPDTMTE